MEPIESKQERRPLSTGDGIAIFALLFFICVWVAGWLLVLALGSPPDHKQAYDGWTTVILLVIVVGPPVWAGSRITEVIRRKEPE